MPDSSPPPSLSEFGRQSSLYVHCPHLGLSIRQTGSVDFPLRPSGSLPSMYCSFRKCRPREEYCPNVKAPAVIAGRMRKYPNALCWDRDSSFCFSKPVSGNFGRIQCHLISPSVESSQASNLSMMARLWFLWSSSRDLFSIGSPSLLSIHCISESNWLSVWSISVRTISMQIFFDVSQAGKSYSEIKDWFVRPSTFMTRSIASSKAVLPAPFGPINRLRSGFGLNSTPHWSLSFSG